MELICKRMPTVMGATPGELTLNGHQHLCYTLEDAVREVEGQPVECWKVDRETAIPRGRYEMTLEDSPRFGPGTMTLNRVPGFVGVRVHAGNKKEDTEGCPLLGLGVTHTAGMPPTITGGTSRAAVDKVKAMVRNAIEGGERVFWTSK